MPAPIKVTGAFVNDFNFYCDRAGIIGPERERLRQDVRADFATVGGFISETVAVYRFCDKTWGYLPSPAYCEGYLASKGWFPADPTIFQRWGILLLAKLCAQAAGVIPWLDGQIAQPPEDPAAESPPA
jgi:hypothetical protein